LAEYQLTQEERLATANWVLRYGDLDLDGDGQCGWVLDRKGKKCVVFSASNASEYHEKFHAFQRYAMACSYARALQLVEVVEQRRDEIYPLDQYFVARVQI
jgi:hypothetical protein